MFCTLPDMLWLERTASPWCSDYYCHRCVEWKLKTCWTCQTDQICMKGKQPWFSRSWRCSLNYSGLLYLAEECWRKITLKTSTITRLWCGDSWSGFIATQVKMIAPVTSSDMHPWRWWEFREDSCICCSWRTWLQETASRSAFVLRDASCRGKDMLKQGKEINDTLWIESLHLEETSLWPETSEDLFPIEANMQFLSTRVRERTRTEERLPPRIHIYTSFCRDPLRLQHLN